MGEVTTLRARVEVVAPDRIRITMLDGQRATPEFKKAIAEAKPILLAFPGEVEFQAAQRSTAPPSGRGEG